MAEKKEKKKKSKVVSVQEDGTEVYGFEQDEKPVRGLSQDDIKEHAKFDKFKGEK